MTRARRPWWFIGLGVLVVSLLVSLGVWQLQRLQWKTALIERVGLLKGLPISVVDDVIAKHITLTAGGIGRDAVL